MIVLIVATICGLTLGLVPILIWNKKYGKTYIEEQLLPLRKKYRICSAFGLMLFMVAFLSLMEVFGVVSTGMWFIAPVVFMSNNRLFFEPYYTSNVVDKIDELCLYLRPFDLSAKNKGYFSMGSMLIPESVEKLLCNELNKQVAKTYCIGDPNQAIPTTLSASGIYASDDSWKASVIELAAKSELIVLRVMETEGCKWELHHCVNNHIEKTIFLLSEGCHLELLNNYISEIKIEAPNVNLINKGCVAIFYNETLNIWEISLLKNVWDIKSLVKKYIKSHAETAIRLYRKASASNVIKTPFKKMNISSVWVHRLTFFLQPFWYIAYNRWPMWWIIIYIIYELISLVAILIIGGVSVAMYEDTDIVVNWVFIIYILLSLPWVWLAPRITNSFNSWGSKFLARNGNIALFKWMLVYMLLLLVYMLLLYILS